LQRSFGLSLAGASQFYGALLLLGGVAGVLGGGWLGDRLGARDKAFYAYVPAAAFALCAPMFALGISSSSAVLAFAVFLVPQALGYMWFGPVLTAIQHLVPATTRSVASALFLLINNLIGLGGGVYALGAVSDVLKPAFGAEALRYSMLFSLSLYLLAAVVTAASGRALRREWVSE
jgi:MFS family permease